MDTFVNKEMQIGCGVFCNLAEFNSMKWFFFLIKPTGQKAKRCIPFMMALLRKHVERQVASFQFSIYM